MIKQKPDEHRKCDTRRIRSAEDHLLAAERSAPNDRRIHFALARMYRMQGKADVADQEMKAFLSAK